MTSPATSTSTWPRSTQTSTRKHGEALRESDEAAAIALVRAHEDKTYSLCDAMSFVVMERMNITDAIAFDRHFAEYGRFALI